MAGEAWVNKGHWDSKKTVKLETNSHFKNSLKIRAQQFVAGYGALRIEVMGGRLKVIFLFLLL